MQCSPLQNKYYKWYISLCNVKQLERGYFSHRKKPKHLTGHHIIPKCFYKTKSKTGWLEGNPNEKSNLVFLSNREHCIAHKLLTKCYEGLAKQKMCFAFNQLTFRTKSSKDYEYARLLHSASMKQLHEDGIINQKGYKHSQSSIEKIREASKKPCSEETKEKIRQAKTKSPHKFTPEQITKIKIARHKQIMIITNKTKEKISQAKKNKKKIYNPDTQKYTYK